MEERIAMTGTTFRSPPLCTTTFACAIHEARGGRERAEGGKNLLKIVTLRRARHIES